MFWAAIIIGLCLQFGLFAYFFHGRYILQYGRVKHHATGPRIDVPVRYTSEVKKAYPDYIPRYVTDSIVASYYTFLNKHREKFNVDVLTRAYAEVEVVLCHDVTYYKPDKSLARAKGKVTFADELKETLGLVKKYTVEINMAEVDLRGRDSTFLTSLMQHEMLHIYLFEMEENPYHSNPMFKEVGV